MKLNSATTGFVGSHALMLAQVADLAYEPEGEIRSKLQEWDLNRFRFFQSGETQAFLAGDDENVILAFRGTEPKKPEDWITDLKVRMVSGPLGGKVHRGFLAELYSVWHPIQTQIEEWQTNGESLWVTGHSLGAALATLAVAVLIEDDQPVSGLYTFGHPRTGNDTFARRFDNGIKGRAFRCVNAADIVTRVPPRSIGYRHVGSLRYFDEHGTMHEDISQWLRFLTRLKVRIEDFGTLGPAGVNAHSRQLYIENMRQI